MAFRQTVEFKRAEHFFEAAQKRMGLLLCRSTVVEAQCFFLAGVYLMATLRPLEAWKMFVQALTCCQAFVPEQSAGEDRESEQRLQEGIYWTCFKSELYVPPHHFASQPDRSHTIIPHPSQSKTYKY